MSKWTPVEVLPKRELGSYSSVDVLCFISYGDQKRHEYQRVLAYNYDNKTFIQDNDGYPTDYTKEVTHWQHLPKDPKQTK